MVLEGLLQHHVHDLQVACDRQPVVVAGDRADGHPLADRRQRVDVVRGDRPLHVQPGAPLRVAGPAQPSHLLLVVLERALVQPGLVDAAQPGERHRLFLGPGVERVRDPVDHVDGAVEVARTPGASGGPVVDRDPGARRAVVVDRHQLAAGPRCRTGDLGLDARLVDRRRTGPGLLVGDPQRDEGREVVELGDPCGPSLGERGQVRLGGAGLAHRSILPDRSPGRVSGHVTVRVTGWAIGQPDGSRNGRADVESWWQAVSSAARRTRSVVGRPWQRTTYVAHRWRLAARRTGDRGRRRSVRRPSSRMPAQAVSAALSRTMLPRTPLTKAGRLVGGEVAHQVQRLGDRDRVGHVVDVQHLEDRQPQHVAVHRRHPLERPALGVRREHLVDAGPGARRRPRTSSTV